MSVFASSAASGKRQGPGQGAGLGASARAGLGPRRLVSLSSAERRRQGQLGNATSSSPDKRTVHFVTWQTDGEPFVTKIGKFPEPVNNVITDKSAWNGYATKIVTLLTWLDAGGAADDDLVAAFDGGDVVWGGCPKDYFVEAYHDIAKQSGAPIVFGAELNCYEQDCRKVPEIPSAANMKWDQFVDCQPKWNDQCAEHTWCDGCSEQPAMQFLNSGFYMGPAKDVKPMLQWVKDKIPSMGSEDQRLFAEYWLQHPKDVVLDYRNQLVLNLARLKTEAVTYTRESGIVQNNVANRAQCFLHGNGPSGKDVLNVVVKDMKAK